MGNSGGGGGAKPAMPGVNGGGGGGGGGTPRGVNMGGTAKSIYISLVQSPSLLPHALLLHNITSLYSRTLWGRSVSVKALHCSTYIWTHSFVGMDWVFPW